MNIRFTTHRWFATTPDRLFDFTNDAANFVSFTGFGPIPGIRKAVYETEGRPALGSRRRVFNTDGTEHVEEIVVIERPHVHTSRISGLAPPFAWLVRFAEDEWRFVAEGEGTRVDRTFTFALTSIFAAPVALLILPLMKIAVRRDLANVERNLSRAAAFLT